MILSLGAKSGPTWDAIPEPLQYGLVNYFEHRLQPGSFLRAVLENDHQRAMQLGDEEARAALLVIVTWCFCNAHRDSFGSKDVVADWLAG